MRRMDKTVYKFFNDLSFDKFFDSKDEQHSLMEGLTFFEKFK